MTISAWGNILAVAFSSDGSQIVSGSEDKHSLCAGLGCINRCEAEGAEGPYQTSQFGHVFK